MAIDVYWGSGSPYSWRVLLALEHKGLPYAAHLLQLSKQEHKSPQMLALNPRGRVPVLKDGDYVVFESLAVLYYLERKYPQPPIFGAAEEAGVIMRVICEYQAYTEPYAHDASRARSSTARAIRTSDESHATPCTSSRSEARTIEGRLSQGTVDRRRQYSARRHRDLSGHPSCCCAPRATRGRANLSLALPADGEQLSGAGALDCSASRRCPATNAPILRIGATVAPDDDVSTIHRVAPPDDG